MKYEYLKHLKENSKSIKLINSDNFALSLSFFYMAFVKERNTTLTHTTILQYLDDYLYDINQSYQEQYPKAAKDYLEDFSSENYGYLRKYYDSDDETLYELTPHTQKALEFIESLEHREFVGSRSKFNIVFELLEELEFETGLDDTQRIERLEQQKRDIDVKIESIRSKSDMRFDSSRIKEHFMQIDEIVRKLKYDFAQIEYNFRDLNRSAMESIIQKDSSKGDVLGSIFDIDDSIRQSDQGKSFFAFWQILTEPKRSQRLSELLENLYNIDTIEDFDREKRLKDLKYTLLQSAQKISKVSSKLIEQLRRFLDDRVWAENRRILELSKSIQKRAIDTKHNMPSDRVRLAMAGDKIQIDGLFERSLYSIKSSTEFSHTIDESSIEIDMDSFYRQFYIDEELLRRNVAQILLHQPKCSIEDISDRFGIQKGVSELIGYISIAQNSDDSMIVDEKITLRIDDEDGNKKSVTMPNIIFVR